MLKNIFLHRIVRFANVSGLKVLKLDGTAWTVPAGFTFLGFQPSIVASFVAGATAAQSGTTVTVTANAHGIIGDNTRDGFRIYFPGSPSIPAGWYNGFAWVSANAISFQRGTATVASEQVNGGAAFISAVEVASATIKGGLLSAMSRLTCYLTRRSDTSAATKTVRVKLDGTQLAASVSTSTPNFVSQRLGFVCQSPSSQTGLAQMENTASAQAPYNGAVDTTADCTLTVEAQLSAAGAYICIDALTGEIA